MVSRCSLRTQETPSSVNVLSVGFIRAIHLRSVQVLVEEPSVQSHPGREMKLSGLICTSQCEPFCKGWGHPWTQLTSPGDIRTGTSLGAGGHGDWKGCVG